MAQVAATVGMQGAIYGASAGKKEKKEKKKKAKQPDTDSLFAALAGDGEEAAAEEEEEEEAPVSKHKSKKDKKKKSADVSSAFAGAHSGALGSACSWAAGMALEGCGAAGQSGRKGAVKEMCRPWARVPSPSLEPPSSLLFAALTVEDEEVGEEPEDEEASKAKRKKEKKKKVADAESLFAALGGGEGECCHETARTRLAGWLP